jgi:diguanylate cyclase (GGDEF)-like protein/PAS domain S-box-containing protein
MPDELNEGQKSFSKIEEDDFKIRFALECADSVNWEMSPDFKKIIFSDNFETRYGIRQADYNYDFEAFVNLHLKPHKEQIFEDLRRYSSGETDMYSGEISLYDNKGKKHWLLVRGKFINDERKLIYGVSINITERKLFEQRLTQMAYFDSQTGLYRPDYISDVFAGRIESARLTDPGLMMLNISRFRDVNAVFGHERGDAVLIRAAKRLSGLTDNLLAKINAGGFIIVFNRADTARLEKAARSILKAFEKPLDIEGQSYYISFKIGIALPRDGVSDFGMLMKDAELAVNHIKNDEVNHVCVINDEIRSAADDSLNLIYELRQATRNNEFLLLFQPIIHGHTKKASGAEALIRWRHPQRGIVSPAVFIPLAEQTGLIIQIGDFVLQEAVKQLAKCMEMNKDFHISINVSVVQLMSPGFIERVQSLLAEHSLPPANLMVEVTESVFITDMAHIIHMLGRLREIGVKVSLDDFGTGYSSLHYLAKIPLDNLKIDRSFLWDALNDPTSEAILKSIISLARNLNLSITAEGVETEEQLELLKTHGSDYIQGFYFSKPIPPDDLERYMQEK